MEAKVVEMVVLDDKLAVSRGNMLEIVDIEDNNIIGRVVTFNEVYISLDCSKDYHSMHLDVYYSDIKYASIHTK